MRLDQISSFDKKDTRTDRQQAVHHSLNQSKKHLKRKTDEQTDRKEKGQIDNLEGWQGDRCEQSKGSQTGKERKKEYFYLYLYQLTCAV